MRLSTSELNTFSWVMQSINNYASRLLLRVRNAIRQPIKNAITRFMAEVNRIYNRFTLEDYTGYERADEVEQYPTPVASLIDTIGFDDYAADSDRILIRV